jgi:hypothetical protein
MNAKHDIVDIAKINGGEENVLERINKNERGMRMHSVWREGGRKCRKKSRNERGRRLYIEWRDGEMKCQKKNRNKRGMRMRCIWQDGETK